VVAVKLRDIRAGVTISARFTLREIVDQVPGTIGHYIIDCELLPCGHRGVGWNGWKSDGAGGMRLEPSLESHVVLRCYICGALQPLGPATPGRSRERIDLRAHGVRCPSCRARPGVYCTNADGSPRMGYCRSRWRRWRSMR
jgi:hypothetical protein